MSNLSNRPLDIVLTPRLLLVIVTLLGACLRFWGLGGIGLHGDEETMGLAVRGILETGHPILPSGMYYSRALPQIYLMAASVGLFGESEWALRLPSVIAGIIMIPVAYFLGRRFLNDFWSVCFSLIIAILPAMIAVSQTARMYVFYILLVMIFAVQIFRWEKSSALKDLLLALCILAVGMILHRLTIFASLLFFFPAFTKKSWRMLLHGGIAFSFAFVPYLLVELWTQFHYYALPREETRAIPAEPFSQRATLNYFLIVGILTIMALAVWLNAARLQLVQCRDPLRLAAVGLLGVSILAAATLHYHIAGLAFAAGLVICLRTNIKLKYLTWLCVVLGILFAAQWFLLDTSDTFAGPKQILIEMLEPPNPWPYFRFATFFPPAVAAYCLLLIFFAWRFIKGANVPEHVLFVAASVWAPLFLIGFFQGYIQPRYSSGLIAFFILGSLAGLMAALTLQHRVNHNKPGPAIGILLVTLLLFISPADLWHNVNPRYSDFPWLSVHRGVDHKGAAEYASQLDLGTDDIVIAEDILQQTWYLGTDKIDFWLRSFEAGNFAFVDGAIYRDIYTGTQQIGDAAAFEKILNDPDRGSIYIIGSGETKSLPSYYLGEAIMSLLDAWKPEVLFTGRDGSTQVLRIGSPGPAVAR